jgi:choline dehydrogenase-like flavoprotein
MPNTATYFHYVGACKTGPSHDPHAVEDPQLWVHEIKVLGVKDASTTINIVSRNTVTNYLTNSVAPELAGSSPYLQETAIGSYPETAGYTLHPPANLP